MKKIKRKKMPIQDRAIPKSTCVRLNYTELEAIHSCLSTQSADSRIISRLASKLTRAKFTIDYKNKKHESNRLVH